MKKTILGFAAAIGALLAVETHAQKVSDFNTLGLQPIPRDQVPAFGTFWVEGPNGLTAPLPCPPRDQPNALIYALPNGQFLVDARETQTLNAASEEIPVLPAQTDPIEPSPLDGPTPSDVSSNLWYSQISVSNYS